MDIKVTFNSNLKKQGIFVQLEVLLYLKNKNGATNGMIMKTNITQSMHNQKKVNNAHVEAFTDTNQTHTNTQ